jgi:hypothetical protein
VTDFDGGWPTDQFVTKETFVRHLDCTLLVFGPFGLAVHHDRLCFQRSKNMLRRSFVLGLAVALVAWVGTAQADDVKMGTHEGIVVKVDGSNLTMSDKAGKTKHTHAVPSDAKITMGGKPAKLADLKAGTAVKVTAEKKGEKAVITKIEGKK